MILVQGGSKKRWKPALTMNGHPYVVGTVNGALCTPNKEERNEFEDLLRTSAGVTKVLTIQDAFPNPLFISIVMGTTSLSIGHQIPLLPPSPPTPKAERRPPPQSAPATPSSPVVRTSPPQQPPLPAKTLPNKPSLLTCQRPSGGA